MNSIRVGSVTNEQLDELNKRAILPTDDDPYITICSTNNKASSINDARIGLIEGDPFVFEAIKNGDAPKDAQCEEIQDSRIYHPVPAKARICNYQSQGTGYDAR